MTYTDISIIPLHSIFSRSPITFTYLDRQGFKERERGRLVLYTTTMGIVRGTYQKCLHVRQILRTLMVQFEERDLFLSTANQQELRERLDTDQLQLPQLFLEGQLLGVSPRFAERNQRIQTSCEGFSLHCSEFY